ncbi:hypothetical protein FJO69_00985 [[Mycoplasma] falconis]|uniref:Uncharacterized protein n=1 Tax=[Mycoplasma] falconis TaxID=92403 RepID=A0A501XAV1_9BACT|nr:hypothetical protein [[Mycoplasma] falconis]TPE57758.1 hypothetical protein FJO69_00985 [[Mycoplasma] falconis]
MQKRKNKGLLLGILATITSISTLFPLIKQQVVNDPANDIKKIINIANDIINNYDISEFPDIIKNKEELEDLIEDYKNNEYKILDKTKELKDSINDFVNKFNKEIENLTINFFEGYKNIELYNNKYANQDIKNSSFLENHLLGWDVNNKIKDEIIKASEKYFETATQKETIKAKTEQVFDNLVNQAYKINLEDWNKPNVHKLSKKEIENKYLSVIYETSRVLRKYLLNSLKEGAKFISESRFVLPNNVWFQMMNKTFGYFALNGEEAENYGLKYINDLKLEDYNEENGWVIPDDKHLFIPNSNYMQYYSDLWPYYFMNSEQDLYWSIYPYFAYAYLHDDILDVNNTALEDEPDDYFIFSKFGKIKSIYDKDIYLDDFLNNQANQIYLQSKHDWFNNEPFWTSSQWTYNDLNFSFNIFQVLYINATIGYSIEQIQMLKHKNISILNYKYFENAVSLFDEIIKNKVLKLKEKLKSKKLELETDEPQDQEIITNINKLLAFPEYNQVQETLMKKYEMFKDGFISKAEEILK